VKSGTLCVQQSCLSSKTQDELVADFTSALVVIDAIQARSSALVFWFSPATPMLHLWLSCGSLAQLT
jgi:hypothetical protein